MRNVVKILIVVTAIVIGGYILYLARPVEHTYRVDKSSNKTMTRIVKQKGTAKIDGKDVPIEMEVEVPYTVAKTAFSTVTRSPTSWDYARWACFGGLFIIYFAYAAVILTRYGTDLWTTELTSARAKNVEARFDKLVTASGGVILGLVAGLALGWIPADSQNNVMPYSAPNSTLPPGEPA